MQAAAVMKKGCGGLDAMISGGREGSAPRPARALSGSLPEEHGRLTSRQAAADGAVAEFCRYDLSA